MTRGLKETNAIPPRQEFSPPMKVGAKLRVEADRVVYPVEMRCQVDHEPDECATGSYYSRSMLEVT